jgi:ParB-like chromosome segregation protein Spo0J
VRSTRRAITACCFRRKPTGFYLVNAGEGRRLAQLLRAKRKEIKADEPIPCMLDTEHNGTELSLAENAIRRDMHPADQYEAFAKVHNEDGMSAEDIAARFGVTPAVVRQRLKLGAVSPKLMALYRKGEMNLDQLSAFAITEDHERQERVWHELPRFQRHREAILRALSEGQVRSDDRRALFVGAKAYEAVGGVIIRDLFDEDGGGFFTDAELLNRLAHEKLEKEAEGITKEGWRWVVAGPELERRRALRRVCCKSRKRVRDLLRQLAKLDPREKHQLRDCQHPHLFLHRFGRDHRGLCGRPRAGGGGRIACDGNEEDERVSACGRKPTTGATRPDGKDAVVRQRWRKRMLTIRDDRFGVLTEHSRPSDRGSGCFRRIRRKLGSRERAR